MKPSNSPLAASLWMIGAILSFTSMAVAGRAVSTDLDTFEIMLYRSVFGLIIVIACGWAFGTLKDVRTGQLGRHGLRNLSHFAGQNLWFYAITAAPLTQVFALEFTAPIWAMFLAVLVLGERLTRTRVASAIVGFFGVLLVTQPWMSDLSPGTLAAAVAAIGFAGSAVLTRLLTRREAITSVMFWLTAMQLVFGIVCAGFDMDIALPNATNLPGIIVIAIAGLVAHYCLTTALSLAPAAVVMPIDFARLPIIALVGLLLYGESVSLWVILGAIIIFGANYANIYAESRSRRN